MLHGQRYVNRADRHQKLITWPHIWAYLVNVNADSRVFFFRPFVSLLLLQLYCEHVFFSLGQFQFYDLILIFLYFETDISIKIKQYIKIIVLSYEYNIW